MTSKFTSTIAGASLLITFVGLIGRGLGLIREIIFAGYFGLKVQYDLYLIGAVLPITINTVILYLGQNFLIPNYNRYKTESDKKAENFIRSAFWLFLSIGFVLSLFLEIFSRPLINFYVQGAASSALETTVNVFRIFIITVPLSAAASVLSAYLQAEFEYKFPAYSQLFVNISVIILVVFFSGGWGIYSIPAGYALGTFLQLLYLISKAGKTFNFKFLNAFKTGNVLNIINSAFVFTVLIESISQVYLIADRYLYHQVDKGGIAALNYAINIFLLPVSIFSAALSTALFPKLSRSFSTKSGTELEKRINNFFTINLFIFVPISFIFVLYGDIIIRILFQRGAFNTADTQMTFEVLKIYCVSLIFYSSYAVLNKLLYSAELVKQLLIITAAGCLLKIALNFLLVGDMQQSGLALSTTISYIFFFISAIILVYLKLEIKNKTLFAKELIFTLLNAIVSYAAAQIIINSGLFGEGMTERLLSLLFFVLFYSLNAYFADHNSFKFISGVFKSVKDAGFKIS